MIVDGAVVDFGTRARTGLLRRRSLLVLRLARAASDELLHARSHIQGHDKRKEEEGDVA